MTDVNIFPETADIMRRAADVIDEYGHLRWDLGSPRRGMCVAGALNYAEHGDTEFIDGFYDRTDEPGSTPNAVRVLAHHLGIWQDRDPTGLGAVVSWNNSPDVDVAQTLRAAAAGEPYTLPTTSGGSPDADG